MKNIVRVLLILLLCMSLTGCGGENHEGEAKTPSGSSAMAGRNYQDVVEEFEESGFTNIKTVPLDDLITGWLTEEGEVKEVSVGGDIDYSADKWVPEDTEVLIVYHTFPVEENKDTNLEDESKTKNEINEVWTIENSPELAAVLALKNENDSKISEFAQNYKGETIEFDASVRSITNHDGYTTRYNVLVSAGDFDTNTQQGPNFQFCDVNYYDLGLEDMDVENVLSVGQNIHVIAEVGEYNEDNTLFELKPVLVTIR